MSRLVVIGWNVHEGHAAAAVRRELQAMIRNQSPDVLVLFEARNLHGRLAGLGYQVVQYAPRARRKGNVSNNGNVAILIRSGLRISGRLALVMGVFWKGPKHGRPQDPRTYRWVRVRKGGRVWKVGGFHLPFGAAARAESQTAIVAWFKRTAKGRATVAVGDWNMTRSQLQTSIAGPAGARIAAPGGTAVDMALYRSCALAGATSLGRHGSDHDAKKYVLTKP